MCVRSGEEVMRTHSVCVASLDGAEGGASDSVEGLCELRTLHREPDVSSQESCAIWTRPASCANGR